MIDRRRRWRRRLVANELEDVGVYVEQCNPGLHKAPEHLVAAVVELIDALLQLLQPLHQRHRLLLLLRRRRRLLDQAHQRRRLPARARRRRSRRRHGRHGVEKRRGRGGGDRGRLHQQAGHLHLRRAPAEPEARRPGAVPRGGGEAGELLPGLALRAHRGGEARAVAAADGGQGLGDVLLERDDGLLEAAVGVGEAEEGVEEAVVGGGEGGLGLGEVEELTEGGVERVEVGEAGGDGGGVVRPGADGADVGVEVGEDWVGAAWEADGSSMVTRRCGWRAVLGRRPGRAEREGDGACEAGRHRSLRACVCGARGFYKQINKRSNTTHQW